MKRDPCLLIALVAILAFAAASASAASRPLAESKFKAVGITCKLSDGFRVQVLRSHDDKQFGVSPIFSFVAVDPRQGKSIARIEAINLIDRNASTVNVFMRLDLRSPNASTEVVGCIRRQIPSISVTPADVVLIPIEWITIDFLISTTRLWPIRRLTEGQ